MSTQQKKLYVYGASGHAKVVIDAAEKSEYSILGILDDNCAVHNKNICGYSVLGGFDYLAASADRSAQVILAIGSNSARERLSTQVGDLGFAFAKIIHPSAQLAKGTVIDDGTVVMAGVAVNSDAHIGAHAIVNTGATIDHDCEIGEFVHISPGAHLAGNVKIGKLTHIGIGASIIQGIVIGKESIIGAGAVVVRDVPDNVTAVGVPARVIERHK